MYSCNSNYEKNEYFSSGKLKEKKVFQNKTDFNNGSNYRCYRYYESGKIISTFEMRQNQIEGDYLTYFENGNIKLRIPFKHGIYNGLGSSYNSDGSLKEEIIYFKGKSILEMKTSSFKDFLKKTYYYLNQGTFQDRGSLIYENGHLVKEKSFYCIINSTDTISIKKKSLEFEITMFTYGENNKITNLYIGTLNDKLNIIDTIHNILGNGKNSIKFNFIPHSIGDTLITGKMIVQANVNIDGKDKLFEGECIVYKRLHIIQ